MFKPEYPIVTERLNIRPFTAADFDDVFVYLSDPNVVRYLYWDVRDEDASRAFLAERSGAVELSDEGQRLALAIEWREVGRVVGEVVLRWTSREHRQGEIGFVLNPEFHGKGIAREAAEAMLRVGFDGLGLHRIAGRCDPRNKASAGLLERLGMRREAHLVHDEIFKGEWGDVYIYAILEDEWRAGRADSARTA
jgi:RimJ/RimL family protein N-acetyltransferase